MDSWQNCCLPVTVRTIHKLLRSIKLCTSFQLSFVHYINIYSRIVIQLNMYVKIITSSGFKSTILTDFVQGQLRVQFCLAVFGRCLKFSGSCTYLPEVVVSSAGSSTTRAARHKKEKKPKKTKNTSRIYDLGVVPTRGK